MDWFLYDGNIGYLWVKFRLKQFNWCRPSKTFKFENKATYNNICSKFKVTQQIPDKVKFRRDIDNFEQLQ